MWIGSEDGKQYTISNDRSEIKGIPAKINSLPSAAQIAALLAGGATVITIVIKAIGG
jgi:hypothetical protein